MNLYRLQNFIHFPKNKALSLVNEHGEQVGNLTRVEQPIFEKSHAFCFKPTATREGIIIGIRKSGLKRLLQTEYEVITDSATHRLAEKMGNNIFYFCVTGEVDGQTLLVEENWSGNLELKVNGRKMAYVKQTADDFTTLFQIDEEINPDSSLFAVIILFSFMFRIYKKESDFIESMIADALE